ncbi:hypothetical protein BJ878DRAFT_154582 [Calycina marina]|uniref:Nucleic acid-binding protein n=1 Tax=Calycina marina TaxID=1763456 RepID=A0A9P8CD78_9HELO|nr:hypothetical protein BJ878DRAFT_154582 [Calycina marina]
MSSRLLLFAGSPECDSLDWQRDDLLQNFTQPILRFAGLDGEYDKNGYDAASDHAKWRSIPLDRQHIPTGYSQNNAWQEEHQGVSFFTAESFIEEMSQFHYAATQSQMASIEPTDQALSQFYEKSYAVHNDIACSQLGPASEAETSMRSDESCGNTLSFFVSLNSFSEAKVVPKGGHLTSLSGIPNATYLNSIHPQTMTINVIVGIILVHEPKSITTKRGVGVELIELLVGDETRSGFSINFWLSSSQSDGDELRSTLAGLRPQDVVLIRNVALGSFRNKVHGQSLRNDMTKAYLLYRNKVDESDVGGCHSRSDFTSNEVLPPQLEKTRNVREWVLKFIGAGLVSGKRNGRLGAVKEVLPPDTQ